MPSIACLRRNSTDSYTSVSVTEEPPKKRPMWQTILIIIGVTALVLLFLAFLAIWVAVPIAFMESIAFQRYIMFLPFDSPKDPQYTNPQKYGIDGVINFYFTSQDLDNITLVNIGSWLIMHEEEVELFKDKPHTDAAASEVIASTEKPIVIYLHGVACNRIKPLTTYNIIRKHFLIIAPDHRGFGDSGTNVVASEQGIVSDTVQLYKWIRAKTNNVIYIWGHSLGGALAAHTVKALKEEENIVPMGLVLESTFTTMREEMMNHNLGKIFKWLAYFNQTILDPPERNGLLFRTTTNILSVDCPIMILHAEDDNVIPYFLGKKLYEVAKTQRNLNTQGNVTYHQFAAVGYQHISLTNDPMIPQYINEFMQECTEANMGRG